MSSPKGRQTFLSIPFHFLPVVGAVFIIGTITPSVAIRSAFAADPSPYGNALSESYGEKKGVTSAEQARKAFRGYFGKKTIKIGEIKERDLYFEAEIRDKNGNRIDTVIVDKRTGRIRSIY